MSSQCFNSLAIFYFHDSDDREMLYKLTSEGRLGIFRVQYRPVPSSAFVRHEIG